MSQQKKNLSESACKLFLHECTDREKSPSICHSPNIGHVRLNSELLEKKPRINSLMSNGCAENLCRFRGEGAELHCLGYRNTRQFLTADKPEIARCRNYFRTHKCSFSFACVYRTCAVLCSQVEQGEEKRFSRVVAGCSLTWIIIAAFIVCLLLSR